MRGRPEGVRPPPVIAHQFDLFCMPQLADAGCLEADQNGGSVRRVQAQTRSWIVSREHLGTTRRAPTLRIVGSAALPLQVGADPQFCAAFWPNGALSSRI
jgi:hypothetical protein